MPKQPTLTERVNLLEDWREGFDQVRADAAEPTVAADPEAEVRWGAQRAAIEAVTSRQRTIQLDTLTQIQVELKKREPSTQRVRNLAEAYSALAINIY